MPKFVGNVGAHEYSTLKGWSVVIGPNIASEALVQVVGHRSHRKGVKIARKQRIVDYHTWEESQRS